MQFTDVYIRKLKSTDKKFYVREARGFTLQVLPSGVKTFLYIYTVKGTGKRKHLNLGNYPHVKLADAREQHGIAFNKVKNGIDPSYVEPVDVEEFSTFGQFAELYLEDSKGRHVLDWHKTLKSALNKDILPVWKDIPIKDIRRRDAIALLEEVAKRGVQAINAHKAASGVFDYALEREYLDASPLSGMKRKTIPALKKLVRERALSDNEVRVVWTAIDEGPGFAETKRALKLVLVTAQRPGEVTGLHRGEISGEWWTIPKERTKTAKEHMVYLTPTALELIGNAEGFIFPSYIGELPINIGAMSQLVRKERSYKEVDKVPKLPFYGLERWTPHDLRRTARTYMAKLGILEEHAEAVLNHAKQGMVKIYNQHPYQEEKKDALLRWEAELLRILS